MSLFTKKVNEYDLSYKNDNSFFITLTENSQSEIKWLSFPSEGEYFLIQGAILGSLRYMDFKFVFEKKTEFKCLFTLEKKSAFFRKTKKVVFGVLLYEELALEHFLGLLEDKNQVVVLIS